jgi:exopolysaccharide biosynthesis predicted pyruvyltransferase EpsI
VIQFELVRNFRAYLGTEADVGRSVGSDTSLMEAVRSGGSVSSAPEQTLPPRVFRKIEESRRKLLYTIAHVSEGKDITFVRSYGNLGDHLIYAGVRQLLSGMPYKEISARKDLSTAEGHTALAAGGGDWCHAFHSFSPKVLPKLEKKFKNVILLPTTFDPTVPVVRRVLKNTEAVVFAREQNSYRRIRNLCDAEIAYDTAFFFDYSPYRREGKGVLNAFRVDPETARPQDTESLLPEDNNDISVTCDSLDEWLWTISRHELIRTDRAHVTVAAALMGKRVEYRASSYFKVPAIVEFALGNVPSVRRIGDWEAP